MSPWLAGLLFLAGYLTVGVLAAHAAAWLYRARHIWISPNDWGATMICLLLSWPIVVPVWAAVRLIAVILPSPGERR